MSDPVIALLNGSDLAALRTALWIFMNSDFPAGKIEHARRLHELLRHAKQVAVQIEGGGS